MISFPWISNEIFQKYWNSLWKILYYISKYCPISNSNENTVITNINNIKSSTYSDSNNELYHINNNNNRNNVVNNSRISNSENIN